MNNLNNKLKKKKNLKTKGFFLRKAQSIAELSVLGTLILVAFSTLLSYGQRLDDIQKAKMQAFRKALMKAYARNSSVSYTVRNDGHLVDLFTGYYQGNPTAATGSASVMWTKGVPGSQGSEGEEDNLAYYEANGNILYDETYGFPRQEKTITDYFGNDQETNVVASVWKEQTEKDSTYNLNSVNNESNSQYNYSRSATFSESADTTVWLRYDTTNTDARQYHARPSRSYTSAGTSSASASTANVNQSRSWSVAKDDYMLD